MVGVINRIAIQQKRGSHPRITSPDMKSGHPFGSHCNTGQSLQGFSPPSVSPSRAGIDLMRWAGTSTTPVRVLNTSDRGFSPSTTTSPNALDESKGISINVSQDNSNVTSFASYPT